MIHSSRARREVVVVGGGAAGCGSALVLAENGWKVRLFEKNTLFSGSSSITPGRLGLGFHYVDLQTSEMLLRATIRFVKSFPGFRVGETLPWPHPLRHGRYFIAKDSIFPAAKILRVCEALKQVYTEMVEEDPSNMVFGPPEDFYRILERKEYENDVDTSKVIMGIETAEHLLDWKKFEHHIVVEVGSHKNITIEEHTELVDVKRLGNAQPRYLLTFLCGKEKKMVYSDYVVNSTWYNIEKINELAGFSQLQSQPRSNRLKALLRVRLPNSMLNSHSMFFCMGPFCTLSNLGDGTALMTYAPVTNIEISTEVTVSNNMDRLLTRGATKEEFRLLSEGILRGVACFIPALEQAEILDLGFGIVQTHGTVNLKDMNSPVHKRAYLGVRSEGAGWVSNPGMKLLYLLENGRITTDILEQQFHDDGYTV